MQSTTCPKCWGDIHFDSIDECGNEIYWCPECDWKGVPEEITDGGIGI